MPLRTLPDNGDSTSLPIHLPPREAPLETLSLGLFLKWFLPYLDLPRCCFLSLLLAIGKAVGVVGRNLGTCMNCIATGEQNFVG